jgi:HPt (histidine-containing phosphotransfer) domain-containing protein
MVDKDCSPKDPFENTSPLSDPGLMRLQQEYQNSIPGKLDSIKQLINAVKKSPDVTTLSALRAAVHKLAGNAGTYGYMEVSDTCRQWERELLQKINEPNAIKLSSEWISELDLYHEKIKNGFRR